MSRVGTYVMHIQCVDPFDTGNCGIRGIATSVYTGRTLERCLKQARQHGWQIKKDQEICSYCRDGIFQLGLENKTIEQIRAWSKRQRRS